MRGRRICSGRPSSPSPPPEAPLVAPIFLAGGPSVPAPDSLENLVKSPPFETLSPVPLPCFPPLAVFLAMISFGHAPARTLGTCLGLPHFLGKRSERNFGGKFARGIGLL